MKNIVHVLIIEHKHGRDVSVHETDQDALDTVLAYCEQWWSHEFSEPMPQENVVLEYFANMRDRDGEENFEIAECEVQSSERVRS